MVLHIVGPARRAGARSRKSRVSNKSSYVVIPFHADFKGLPRQTNMEQPCCIICSAVTFCNQLRYSAEKAVVERSVPVGAEGCRGQVRHHLRQLAAPALQGLYLFVEDECDFFVKDKDIGCNFVI